MKSLIAVVVCLILLVALNSYAKDKPDKAEEPNGWPWRGISMDNLSSSPDDIDKVLEELDINTVGLTIEVAKYAKRFRVTGEEALEASIVWANKMLDRCEELEIQGIVKIQNFIFDPNSKVSMRSPLFWRDPDTPAMIKDRVRKVVKEMRGRGEELVAYDFVSEPVLFEDGKSKNPEIWLSLSAELSDIIHEEDEGRWRLASNGPWGVPGAFRNIEMLPYPTVWGAHWYAPHKLTQAGIPPKGTDAKYPGIISGVLWNKAEISRRMLQIDKFQEAYPEALVYISEFSTTRYSDGGEQWIRDSVDVFEDRDWGYSYFCIRCWNGWNPDYNNLAPINRPAGWVLKDDYAGKDSMRWETLRSIF